MPKESEMASQKPKQKPASPLQLKNGSPESGGAASRRSPRSLSESPSSRLRKGGSRVADLEKKLAHAKDEIKKLKENNGEDGEGERLKEKLAEAEAKIRGAEEEAEASRAVAEKLGEKVEAMDAEMRTLRVQTEQWRKAAEAATAALAAATASPRGRCRSMEKSLGIGFEDEAGAEEGGKKKGEELGFWEICGGRRRRLASRWRGEAMLERGEEGCLDFFFPCSSSVLSLL